eukprot:jgi/Mesvir1/28687/Mv11179-RA.1
MKLSSMATPAASASAPKTKKVLSWRCGECERECIPVRDESRCMCGHRLKEHGKLDSDKPLKCLNTRGCTCTKFFYIVAEGSWILRCRCKHKHIEHDPVTHKCTKPNCKQCDKFDSPWVCNCNHPWSSHKQLVEERSFKSLADMMGDVAPEVNDWDHIERGKSPPQG